MKRKYDIGNGVTITDDGYSLTASWKIGENGSGSIGIKRPPIGPVPDEVEALHSADGRYFYLPAYSDIGGFWLSTTAWASRAEMEAQQKAGILGKSGCEITRTDTGEVLYRDVLHFSMWKVRAEPNARKVPKTDEIVKDYLAMAQASDREQERRFNEAIAHSGRTLKWIMARIGPWQAAPPELPPVVLI